MSCCGKSNRHKIRNSHPLSPFGDPSQDQTAHLPSQLPPPLVRAAASIHLCHSSAHNYFRNFYFSSRMNLFFRGTNSTAISSLSTWFFKRDHFYIWADCICSGGGSRLLEIGDKTSVHIQISTGLPQRAYGREVPAAPRTATQEPK